MTTLYHGTTEKAADSILKEGFRAGTYFGQHLEDALHMGGEYIFEVWFEEDPSTYWQWVCPGAIGVDQIRSVYRLEPTMLFDNKDCHRRIQEQQCKNDYDELVVVCDACSGRGQEEDYHPFVRWRDMGDELPVTSCKVCSGHGVVTIDGSDIYGHVRENSK